MNEKEPLPVAEKNEIIVYQPEGGEFHIKVRVENELDLVSTCAKIAQVRMEGGWAIKRMLPYYNLDMIFPLVSFGAELCHQGTGSRNGEVMALLNT